MQKTTLLPPRVPSVSLLNSSLWNGYPKPLLLWKARLTRWPPRIGSAQYGQSQ